MKLELSEKLCKEFPNLYFGRFGDVKIDSIYFNFEVNDGWYDLIYQLSDKIESIINKMPKNKRKYYYAIQVKEKYGKLRFYMSCVTDKISRIIEEYENKSQHICEICGDKGQIFTDKFVRCRCEGCLQKELTKKGE